MPVFFPGNVCGELPLADTSLQCNNCGQSVTGRFCSHCGFDKAGARYPSLIADFIAPFLDVFEILKIIFRPRVATLKVETGAISTTAVLKFYCFSYAITALMEFIAERGLSYAYILNISFNTRAFSIMEAPLIGEAFVMMFGACFACFGAITAHIALRRTAQDEKWPQALKISLLFGAVNIAIFSIIAHVLPNEWEIALRIFSSTIGVIISFLWVIAMASLYERSVLYSLVATTVAGILIMLAYFSAFRLLGL